MKRKNILIITGVVLAIALIVIAVVVKNINSQTPEKEKDLSKKQQQVLMMNYVPVEKGEKQEPKRAIDSTNPLNLVNFYGNEPVETLWDSIPDNQKPYTIILIIPGHTLLPETDSALDFLETTADICEANKIPYAIQNTNGEIAVEERLPIAYLESRFAKNHKYFYGLNAAELYNGVTWRGECESNNSQYIIDCINLCAKYGAFFLWTDTNMNYDSGMVLNWFESNEAFYSAFKENSEYICLLNKESFGNPSTYSCMQGLWMAGLVGNWGVASDWWHWQVDGDKKSLFGENDNLVDNEWDMIMSYPENMYVQSMMLVLSSGGTCFKAEAPNFSTSVGGVRVGGFEYGISPLFDRLIDGTISIPTRQEVLDKTKIAVLGLQNYPSFNYELSESNLYPSTGRYGIIHLLPSNLRKDEISVFNENSILLLDYEAKQEVYDKEYENFDGNTYLSLTGKQWFYINNVENERKTKEAEFVPHLSNASKVGISTEEHSSAIIGESVDRIHFYLSNYRTDKTNMIEKMTPEYMKDKSWIEMTSDFLPLNEKGNPIGVDDTALRTTTIKISGTYNGKQPEIVWVNSADGTGYQNRPYSHEENWNEENQTLTIIIKHNGIVEFDALLDESTKETQTDKNKFLRDVSLSSADTSSLEELMENLKVNDKSSYNDYSYLKFNAAYEKAKVVVSEGTYDVEKIDKAKNELKIAHENLIDISKYTSLLKEASSQELSSKQSKAFDFLLREVTSNLVYVNGRSQKLGYQKAYSQQNFNSEKKVQAMDKKHDKLEGILNEKN